MTQEKILVTDDLDRRWLGVLMCKHAEEYKENHGLHRASEVKYAAGKLLDTVGVETLPWPIEPTVTKINDKRTRYTSNRTFRIVDDAKFNKAKSSRIDSDLNLPKKSS